MKKVLKEEHPVQGNFQSTQYVCACVAPILSQALLDFHFGFNTSVFRLECVLHRILS